MIKETFITIAICTYNRASYLRDTLNDLANQTAENSQFEILVIDNNSSDQTQEVCRKFQEANSNLQFRVVKEKKQGLSYARNRAIEEAETDTLLYIDDDVELKSDFVSAAIDYMNRYPEAVCAGGRIFVRFDESEPDWIPDELMPMFGLHDLGDDERFYPKTNFPRGGNMLIKKEVFDTIGQFDTDLGRIGKQLLGSEEKAFFDRAREHGYHLHYWPSMSLHHRIGQKRLTKEYLKNQSIGIGLSENLRLKELPGKKAVKLLSEIVKFTGSIILSIGYLMRGRTKAASFILQFRIWVLRGFLKADRGGV
ncbi:glycosyltransferase [Rhodohalobacter halophilus]|uniref:glycosyltransferase n=1 Tax=Rhodohalobacter halophilus TaxID=1812810 RepID=UPI00083FBCC0|nr:glycosyltransferase [Rhodohalobacter halophilus]